MVSNCVYMYISMHVCNYDLNIMDRIKLVVLRCVWLIYKYGGQTNLSTPSSWMFESHR